MRHFQKSFYFLFSVLFIACSAARTPLPSPDFWTILQSSCSAPCWNGITPGKTTKAEFLKIIPSLPFYTGSNIAWLDENGQLTQNAPDIPNSSAGMIIGKNWAGISVYIKDSVVSSISISSILNKSMEFNDLKLTLDGALKLYDTPSYILQGGICHNLKCQNLYIIIPEQGMILVVEPQDFVSKSGDFPSYIHVLPQLPIREVVYFNSSKLKNLPTSLEIGHIRCEIQDEIPRWQGYATIDFSKTVSSCN